LRQYAASCLLPTTYSYQYIRLQAKDAELRSLQVRPTPSSPLVEPQDLAELRSQLLAVQATAAQAGAEVGKARQEANVLRDEVVGLKSSLAAAAQAAEGARNTEERLAAEVAELSAAVEERGEAEERAVERCRLLEGELGALKEQRKAEGEAAVRGEEVGVPPEAAARIAELQDEVAAWKICSGAWDIDAARQACCFQVSSAYCYCQIQSLSYGRHEPGIFSA